MNEFVRVLIEAVVIVLAVSFIALGLHKGKALRLVSTCARGWWWR